MGLLSTICGGSLRHEVIMVAHRKRIIGLPFNNLWHSLPEDNKLAVESLAQAAEPLQGLHLLRRKILPLIGLNPSSMRYTQSMRINNANRVKNLSFQLFGPGLIITAISKISTREEVANGIIGTNIVIPVVTREEVIIAPANPVDLSTCRAFRWFSLMP